MQKIKWNSYYITYIIFDYIERSNYYWKSPDVWSLMDSYNASIVINVLSTDQFEWSLNTIVICGGLRSTLYQRDYCSWKRRITFSFNLLRIIELIWNRSYGQDYTDDSNYLGTVTSSAEMDGKGMIQEYAKKGFNLSAAIIAICTCCRGLKNEICCTHARTNQDLYNK